MRESREWNSPACHTRFSLLCNRHPSLPFDTDPWREQTNQRGATCKTHQQEESRTQAVHVACHDGVQLGFLEDAAQSSSASGNDLQRIYGRDGLAQTRDQHVREDGLS